MNIFVLLGRTENNHDVHDGVVCSGAVVIPSSFVEHIMFYGALTVGKILSPLKLSKIISFLCVLTHSV